MADKTSKELIVRRRVRPVLMGDLPQAEDIKIGRDQVLFGKGQWLPSIDPLVIGKENFADLQNLRYGADGLDTIKGHAKINATALSAYLKIRAMHQLVTPYTTKSRILVQAFNTGLAAAQVMQNLSVVPAAADFEATALGATAAVRGRFAEWPAGHVAFCDGATVKVWAGDEMPAPFVSLASDINYHNEYTEDMRNNDVTDVIVVGAAGSYVYLGTSRPPQGFRFNVANPNTTAATMVAEAAAYSTGSIAFSAMTISDGTASGGKTIAQSGKMTISAGAPAAPVFINGLSLYWCRVSFSAPLSANTTVYQILADCAWQTVKSLWSGESMVLLGFKIYDGSKNQDYTSYMNDESQTTGTEDQLDAFATTKKLYIQTASPAQGFMFRFIPGSYNTNAAVMQIKRYQGSFVTVTNFVDKTALSGASFGMNGMVAFDVSEADKTLSLDGETPYFTYEITFSATLSADVELFNVTAIEAAKTIDGYAFPFMFRNRPMLCGYTKGGEGNRVDFGMTDTVDVFTGSDASLGMNNAPLYFGGNDDLTGAIEMYNRLGSTIYHVGVFCKAQETYLLSGYDAETYQIYRISGGIGCPAPQTMDTVEIGYGADQQAELRCIALWLSFVGPVICDTATVTPIAGVECYFDRNDSRCINWSAVEKACGVVDLEYLEYHLCIPSGAGQTTNNVWLVFDLMKHRWYPRVANDGQYPQSFCRVVSTNGTPYVFACYDDGHMRRINTGDTWDTGGTAIACVLKSADILPTGDMWDATRLRYVKLLGVVAAAVSAAITHYKNGGASGTSLTAASLASTNRHSRHVQPVSLLAWSHQLLLTFNAPSGGATLIGMAWEFTVEREDLTSGAGG